jgi:hypothetical protein
MASAVTTRAETALTNDDIVKLSKLGLGDEAVIAKIRQAPDANFHLETDDLAKLKAAGVSSKIIAAMLDRSTGASSTTSVVAGPRGVTPVMAGREAIVKLAESSGKVTALTSMIGEPSSTYVYVTMLFWENFPGLHAGIRTTEATPSFLIATDREPRSRYYVVRLDVNDEDGDRSLKMGRSGAFSFKAGTAPDSSWTFPFDAKEESQGSWRVSLKKPLKPGEYGIFVVESRELFDFGVD